MSRGPSCPATVRGRREAIDEALGFRYTLAGRRGARIDGLGPAASRYARRYAQWLIETGAEMNPRNVNHQGVDDASIPIIADRVKRDLHTAGLWIPEEPGELAPVVHLHSHRRRR